MSDAGIFFETLGQKMRMARLSTPTPSAAGLSVPKFFTTALTLSIVSIVTVPAGYVKPKKSFSWPTRMVTAMPAVKPIVMVLGIKRMSFPSRSTPIRMSKSPAMMVAIISPSMPELATMPATMVAKAAVGPAICTLLPPKAEMRKPAMMAV